jgi:hypothetical protein
MVMENVAGKNLNGFQFTIKKWHDLLENAHPKFGGGFYQLSEVGKVGKLNS